MLQTPESRPYSRPKEALHQALAQMEGGDWEVAITGLNNLTRLARNHPEVLEPQIHTVCVALARNIKNLRSQVARTACRASSEMFATGKRGLDMVRKRYRFFCLHLFRFFVPFSSFFSSRFTLHSS